MWRIQGLVGRALSRYHGNTSSLRLSNHVEDEVISSSSVLSTSRSQRGDDGEQKNKKTTEFCYAGLPRYTALDAVGLGAAAILFMQICRRIHSQFSSVSEHSPGPSCRSGLDFTRKCTHRILLNMLWRGNVLQRGMCLNGGNGVSVSPEHSDNCSSNSITELPSTHQQEETLSSIITSYYKEGHTDYDDPPTETAGDKDTEGKRTHSLEEAEQNLRAVTDNSVPIILNIMGLESAKGGDYKAAFELFQASAQQNYSKAQFNVGVCYEKGWGVLKDLKKAIQHYRRAASAGHTQAQYRCAKLLLNCSRQQGTADVHTHTAASISLLQAAAAAGHTQAQLYLGVMLSQDPDTDGVKSVYYFTKAAQSGNSTGLLFVGQCYETGFGVPQCCRTAATYYEQAAAKGNQQAKKKLRDLHSREVLRSIQSAPCLPLLNHVRLSSMFSEEFKLVGATTKQHPDWPPEALPHSQSTGSLISPPPIVALTYNSSSNSVSWIIGVG